MRAFSGATFFHLGGGEAWEDVLRAVGALGPARRSRLHDEALCGPERCAYRGGVIG